MPYLSLPYHQAAALFTACIIIIGGGGIGTTFTVTLSVADCELVFVAVT